MKTRKTKYSDNHFSLPLTLIAILIYMVLAALLVLGIIRIYNTPVTETGFFQNNFFKFGCIFILCFFLIFMISSVIGNITGSLKGKREISKTNKEISESNPYLYYRELPNNYGIGVTSLLFDSVIENYKDIIAVILDLCAKKYLSLVKKDNKYEVRVLKGVDSNLLDNEKYILELVISNNIANINYKEWYSYCLEDGKKLGLYYHKEIKEDHPKGGLVTKEDLNNLRKRHVKTARTIAIIVFALSILFGAFFIGLAIGLLAFLISYIVPFYLDFLRTSVRNMGKQQQDVMYKLAINNNLTRTELGIEELHKLMSFKNFLMDFGSMVDKHPEEVILWDRYLSYAQVFGITKEIMRTGYTQLIENASFQIDDIDNITVNNIKLY